MVEIVYRILLFFELVFFFSISISFFGPIDHGVLVIVSESEVAQLREIDVFPTYLMIQIIYL